MSALAHDPESTTSADALFFTQPTKYIASLQVREGVRVEYIEGTYSMTPQPNDEHNYWATRLIVQLHFGGETLAMSGNGYCSEPAGTRHVTGAFIPDFAVQYRRANHKDEAFRHSHDGWYSTDILRLVAEVTSPSNHQVDRDAKYRSYARAGIPVYVLIDRQKGEAVAFSDPTADNDDPRYRTETRVRLGDKLSLPDGLPTIDTSVLLDSD